MPLHERRISRAPGFRLRLCAVLMVLGTLAAAAAEEPELKVRSVKYEGNHAYADSRLDELMVNRPPTFWHSTKYQPAVLEDDLTNLVNFYDSEGFLQAKLLSHSVRIDSAEGKVDIRISLAEGAQTMVDRIGVTGNKVFPEPVLLDRVHLKPGDPFRRQPVIDGMLNILSVYADSGYLNTKLLPRFEVDSGAHRAAVVLQVEEGPQSFVDSIRVAGLTRTNEAVVRRELLFHRGDVIQYSDLLESQQHLYMTNLFQSIFIHPDTVGDPRHRTVIVQVREKENGEFNAALSYASVEKVIGRVQVQTTNLAGTGRQLGTTLFANFIKQTLEGDFTEPWTFGTRVRTDLVLLYELQEEPSFSVRRYGGRITVGRSVGLRSNLSLTYRHEDNKLFDVRAGAVSPADSAPRVRGLVLSFRNDERDDPFNTSRGRYLELSAEQAGGWLSGSNNYLRTILLMKWFYAFSPSTILGTSFNVGWMNNFGNSPDVPISERFFAGGPVSIRGFAYQRIGPLDNTDNPLGGKVKLVWNLAELRQAVWKFLGAAAFIDVGQIWGDPRDVHLRDVRWAAGPGLRVNSPLGIVRIDWGFNISPRAGEDRSQVFFSLGQAF